MEALTAKSSGNSGDCISFMASLRKAWKDYGKKAILYLRKDTPAKYYAGCPKHTVVDENEKEVMLNEYMINMLIPLLKSQEYIEDVRIWKGEKVNVDMDDIRVQYTGQPGFSICHWTGFLYHDLHADISERWFDIDVEAGIYKRIVVNRTERYTNQYISYFFLKKYGRDVVFVGSEHEHSKFCKEWDLDIQHYQVKDFLELAKMMKESKVFLGNQSMCACLAEGAKIPRVIELCNYAANVIVSGKDAYGFLHQTACEYYVNLLFNKA